MYGKRSFALMAAGLGALLLSPALAQETQRERVEQRLRQRAGQAGSPAEQGQICLASKVHGMVVKDQSGQAYGKIQDLVIDAQGQVRYLAIAKQSGAQAGARLGAAAEQPQRRGAEEQAQRGEQQRGERRGEQQTGQLTLIPWQVAEFHEGTTPQQSYVSLNIEAEKLQQAPSFTLQQLTAKEGQQQWMAQVNQFFGQLRGAARPQFERGERRQDQPEQRERPNPERDN